MGDEKMDHDCFTNGAAVAFRRSGRPCLRLLASSHFRKHYRNLYFIYLSEASHTSASMVRTGADWLLATLLLFFIPAAVGIIEHSELVSMAGIGLIGMVILSTFLVMSSTGLVAEFISRMRRGNTK
ncbi:CidA/LrgA family protein [Paenibacillus larvae]|nr:CidA/LrgA family protein [Paenibacillus larvae]MDT2288764.1 CidA/LrgA family protein [Paenibacillus larvae]MDT2295173.1 CidA/LrgA family protein [Paenibacillus larvae]